MIKSLFISTQGVYPVRTSIYCEKRELLITTIRYIKWLRFKISTCGWWALYHLHPSRQFHGSDVIFIFFVQGF